MDEQTDSANRTLRLASLLTDETVRARVHVVSWQEAVERVGELLVGSGAVETRYIEAMKLVLNEMGPYAVIAPGIALLHARPEDGVRRPCLALMTLATPVPFGHSQNDPVDLVVALGAVDKQAHIVALQELARLLMDQPTLERIRSAQDDGALRAAIGTFDAGPSLGPSG
ncbi:MAG: PTS sugar transporter subunit IIA [Anaerolineales bacterium]|nr:PTS sugar transporter subunit IIA [Anaerolineales bacterium]